MTRAHEEVLKACNRLVENGLIARTWGNVSCRVDQDHYVITPSGRAYSSLKEEDLVVISLKDGSYKKGKKPSGEKGMHSAIYKEKPETNCVVHTHQTYASVLSVTSLSEVTLNENGIGKVQLAEYGLPSTKKLVKNIIDALRKSDYPTIIMKKHGAVILGDTVNEVFDKAMALESACKKYVQKHTKVTNDENYEVLPSIIHREIAVSENYGVMGQVFDGLPEIDRLGVSQLPEIKEIIRQGETLKPLLDDFAQLIGPKVNVIPYDKDKIIESLKRNNVVLVEGVGAVFVHESPDELLGIRMVLEKNALAWVGGKAVDMIKPLNLFDTHLMRMIYLKKYSKQKEVIK